MNDLTILPLTMTSREIAELTGKQHKHVLRDIDNLVEELGPNLGLGLKSTTYADITGKSNRQYEMDQDSVYCLMTGYDANSRMKIIKRWQELETKSSLPDFSNPAIAARAWADEYERRQKAERENALLNTIIDNEFGYCSILRAAKFLRVHERTFNWRPLKAMTKSLGLEVRQVPSPRYEYQLLYPIRAFELCYPDFDFEGLQPEPVVDIAMASLGAPKAQAPQAGALR